MSGGGGAPAVQAQYSYSSPFQNPAYNAVAMGTKQSPGPIARSIQIGNQLAQNWQDSYTGANPGAYYGITKEQATPQFLANQRLQQGAWSPPNSQTAAGVNQFDPDRNRTIAVANPNLPTQTAAQGGLMSLGNFGGGRSSGSEAVNPQGYAKGGPAKPKYNAKSSADDKLNALQTAIDGGYKPKSAEVTFMQGMADSAAARQKLGSDVPFSVDPKTGQIKPAARGANQSSADYAKYLGQLDTAGAKLDPKTVKQYGVQTGAATQQQNKTSGVNAPYSLQQAVEQRTAYFDPTTGESTNPLFRQAVDEIKAAQKLPEQFGQATTAYNQGIKGLQSLANYQPQSITGSNVQAAQADRGNIRDIQAQMADVEKYRAAMMRAPTEANVQDYQAAQAQLNQMSQPEDVTGQTYQAANIAPTQREQAQQIGDIGSITGQGYSAAQIAPTAREAAQQVTGRGYSATQMGPVAREAGVTTAAPKTWTDPGVAQQYMNPYMQNVTDIAKRESMRDYGKQLSALNAQAAKSKAYGGSRQAIERSEASRAQGYKLADIENQGLSQAYQQGMGQFQAEQGLGSQVGMSNTAQINQLKSQYMQLGMTEAQANQAAQNQAAQFTAGQLQAADVSSAQMVNQLKSQYMSMGLSEAQANQAAINQAQQFSASQGQTAQAQNVANQLAMQQSNAQMVNQLKSQYMSMGLSEAQANQAAQNQAAQYSAGNLQQAALANQQAGLTAGQANLSAAQQTALANQQATNQQQQQYVNNALQAAMQAYGGQLTAAQQNQVAKNAASQFNAQAQNTAYNNYVAQQLAAQQSNQQMDWNTAQFNAQNQQQAALANQLYGVGGFNAQAQNQQAGLTANQQNIGAYGQMLSGAQGLGSLGGLQSQTNLANIGALGQAAQAQQNLGQQYLNNVQQSAQNYFNWPQQQLSYPINAINQLPSSGGATTQTQRPASALGWKKGGLMNLRKARRA